jgi:cellulose synthase operon protein C
LFVPQTAATLADPSQHARSDLVIARKSLHPASILCALWVALSATTFFATDKARAESPYDARAQRHVARALAKGKDPSSTLELMELLRESDRVDPKLARSLYEKLAQNRALGVEQRMLMARAAATSLRRAGDLAGSIKAFQQLGYLSDFRVIGPFDNEGKRGFDFELGPERDRKGAVKVDAEFDGRERKVRWRKLPDVVQAGQVDFDSLLRPNENVCALAETTLHLDKAGALTLWLGGGGANKLYFDGEEVLRDAAYRGHGYERNAAKVSAPAGDHRLLVKSCTTNGPLGFALRVGDARGEPLVLAHRSDRHDAVTAGAQVQPAPLTVLAALEKAAAVAKPQAAALENLARFLWYSNADDPAERRARQLALRAADLQPSAPRYLLASALAEERYEKARLLEKARKLAPNDGDVNLALTRVVSNGPGSERALHMLDEPPAEPSAALDALALRALLLRGLGLRDSAKGVAKAALARAPTSEALLELNSDIASEETRKDELLRLSAQLLAVRYDHFGARRALTEGAIAAGRDQEALAQLDVMRALWPNNERRTLYVADLYDALGKDDQELATIQHALEITPESTPLHVRMGRALLRAGRNEQATESLRRALALSPQDAATRDLLEQIAHETRLDEAYAAPRDALLARRVGGTDQPVTILNDLNVSTVFENGLGSRFVQFAAQVHDAEGARRLRARSIQFDPETQRVDVRLARVYRADGRVLEATESYEEQLGEPWYRVYYDTRALVVVFPDLEPGDSVELRYRVDDVAQRNVFADYFGDLHLFAGAEPRQQVEYVLITPSSRKFYVNKPKLALEQREETQGTRRIQHFVAKNVPAVRSEPNMPGVTETVPYLHVSTYENWDKVGRWWWGLVRDQLYADDDLKRVVAELKKGAPQGSNYEREIAERVYGWVVANTRYVALEFGIHGFLPYRVPDILRRGFGDCKDKASLIYTMLREAGVDARLVLVRTDRNGDIGEEPASLSVFDHAIAYVPKLDLFLDGTAEHSGTRELPAGDQGVMVLVVGPDSVQLRKTPVLPAESNLRQRKVEITLDEDGAGMLSSQERIAGSDAARYRSTFEATGTQRERLERQLASGLPGLSLEQHAFTGLDNVEQDVTLNYRIRAPQLARIEGNELRIGSSGMSDLVRELAGSPTRSYPLDLGLPRVYREERTIHAPKGFVVRKPPEGGEVKSRFGSLSVHNEQSGSGVVSRTAFELLVKRVEPGDYAQFRAFVERADGLLRQRITFSKESQ